MDKFQCFTKYGTCLGTSELKFGNAKDFSALGLFHTTEHYKTVQPYFIEQDESEIKKLGLYVLSPTGRKIEPVQKVTIADDTRLENLPTRKASDLGYIELQLLGVDPTLYNDVFKKQVEFLEESEHMMKKGYR
jgi:hypothetical protein